MIEFTPQTSEKMKNFWHFTLRLILDVPSWIDEETGLIMWATSNGNKTVSIFHDHYEGLEDRLVVWKKSEDGSFKPSGLSNCDTDLVIYFNMYNFQFSIFNTEWMRKYTRDQIKSGLLEVEESGEFKYIYANPIDWNIDKPYGKNKIFVNNEGKEILMYYRSAFLKDRILY